MARLAAAVALLLTVAGCAAPTATADSDAAGADDVDIVVQGGGLAVDANRTFVRVQAVLGTAVREPRVVFVRSDAELAAGLGDRAYPEFYRLLGITRPVRGPGEIETTGYTRGPDAVYLNERIAANRTAAEVVLAHEYVHAVQYRSGAVETVRRELGISQWSAVTGVPLDTWITYLSVLEGGAVYATDAYWRAHVRTGERPGATLVRRYRAATGGAQLVLAPYYFGRRYVESRVDSPTALGRVYRRPPRTSEQVLHGLRPGEEPPAPLSVTVADGAWRENGSRTTAGELFVRVTLGTELDREVAARGADGWGNDTRIRFARDGAYGYAWVLRWDDAAEAAEFADAFRTYLDRRATRTDDGWYDGGTAFELVRAGDRTVVAFLGPRAFVRAATASGDRDVTVRLRERQREQERDDDAHGEHQEADADLSRGVGALGGGRALVHVAGGPGSRPGPGVGR